MDTAEVVQALEALLERQYREAFILTGLYLEGSAVQLLVNVLEPDDPSVGALGRYSGVPVFELIKEPPQAKQHGVVAFTSVEMRSVN